MFHPLLYFIAFILAEPGLLAFTLLGVLLGLAFGVSLVFLAKFRYKHVYL